jgi:endonuclease III-like uncharacterized protein
MTANSASNFLDRGWQLQEATRYATRVFKRLLYIACSHSDEFHPEMTGAIEGFEQELFDQLETVKQVTQEFHKNTTCLSRPFCPTAPLASQQLCRIRSTSADRGLITLD